MHINRAREVINEQTETLRKEFDKKLEKPGATIYTVTAEDPFLAGQIYAMSMLMLKLNIVELEQQDVRDRQRRNRCLSP